MSGRCLLMVAAGAALTLGSCGGSSKGDDVAAKTATQAAAATSQSTAGASGTAGSTAAGKGSAKKRAKGGQATETGGASPVAKTSTPAKAADGKRSSSKRRSSSRKRKKRDSSAPFFTSKQVYKQGKGGCKILGINAIVREWEAKSFKPTDVAKAYADAWVKGGAPARTHDPMYRGCLAGLRERERQGGGP